VPCASDESANFVYITPQIGRESKEGWEPPTTLAKAALGRGVPQLTYGTRTLALMLAFLGLALVLANDGDTLVLGCLLGGLVALGHLSRGTGGVPVGTPSSRRSHSKGNGSCLLLGAINVE
jgi:hypothetical protein